MGEKRPAGDIPRGPRGVARSGGGEEEAGEVLVSGRVGSVALSGVGSDAVGLVSLAKMAFFAVCTCSARLEKGSAGISFDARY